MGDSPDRSIRVSDAERNLAVTALWEHLETGRLKPGEHEERSALAAAATTRVEIEALFADLPAPHPDLSQAVALAGATDKPHGSPAGDTLAAFGAVALLSGTPVAIMLTVSHGMWWTLFSVIGLTALFLGLSAMADRRHAERADS